MTNTTVAYTTPGSYTGTNGWLCPVGVTSITVECEGGGGGGGSGAKSTFSYGGGGGRGGDYASKVLAVVPGTRYDIVVGAGGNGGAAVSSGNGNAGTSGGASYFISTSTVCAAGGGPGAGGSGSGAGGTTTSGTSVGTTINAGTNGSSAVVSQYPGGAGGAGGTPRGGGGGAGGPGGSSTPGATGTSPGGGGGGGAGNTSGTAGGAGAAGGVWITYVQPVAASGVGSLTLNGAAATAGTAPVSGTGSIALSGSGNATGPISDFSTNTPGAGTWTATFTGPALVYLWGGGGGGNAGKSLTSGGVGGGGAAAITDIIEVVQGTTYSFFIGHGGAGGSWSGGVGYSGEASYWGDGSSYRAAGGGANGVGGSISDCVGRSRVAGHDGTVPTDYSGGAGGAAASIGAHQGGAGAPSPGQNPGTTGYSPGGGGSGGGQNTGGDGGAGAPGGIFITQGSDTSIPGYYSLGVDASWNFSGAGTYDDFIPAGEGTCWVECVGGGGGGRGGNAGSLQGSHGGGGGAYAASDVAVRRGVMYRRIVANGGVGGAVGFGNPQNGTNGGDSSFTLTPLRVIQKQLTNNVATLWTYHPTTAAAQIHGFEVGDSVTVAGVDATFNGTFTVTAVATDRKSFSYAKVASNVGLTAVTPASNQVTRTTPIVMAKGGGGGTGQYNSASTAAEAGGQASASIGTVKVSGGDGNPAIPNTTNGGNGAGAGLPLGGQGGWGGGTALNSNPASNGGDPGQVPGGAGGGGAGQNNGNAGNGATGAVVIRWITSLCRVYVNGEMRDITRVRYKAAGSWQTIKNISAYKTSDTLLHSTVRTRDNPESRKRRWPSYLPESYKDRFDRNTGTFNWLQGAPHVRPAILANDFDCIIVGDSVAEGWTYLDRLPPYSSTGDFPNAYPRKGRDLIVAATPGTTIGGTGIIRPDSSVMADTQWTLGSNWTKNVHYISSSNTGSVATFNPGNTTDESGNVAYHGTKMAVVTSGGQATIAIDGTVVGTTSATSGAGVLARWESPTLSDAHHSLTVTPVGGTVVNLFGASLYTPSGIRVHNLGQGGAYAGVGDGSQKYWGAIAGGAPTNMTPSYSQPVFSKASKNGGRADAVFIMLGGNDDGLGSNMSAAITADILQGYANIGQAFDGPNTDIIICPDIMSGDQALGLMNLCITNGWAMIDFFWYSRGLTAIFDNHYNGDTYGHPNAAGTHWLGGMMRDAFLYNPI